MPPRVQSDSVCGDYALGDAGRCSQLRSCWWRFLSCGASSPRPKRINLVSMPLLMRSCLDGLSIISIELSSKLFSRLNEQLRVEMAVDGREPIVPLRAWLLSDALRASRQRPAFHTSPASARWRRWSCRTAELPNS